MATLNILLPSPMTISPYNSNSFKYIHTYHTICFNTKLQSLQNSHFFSVTKNKSTPSHKFSRMSNHLQKSVYNGSGDRADRSTWPEVKGPLTVLLFEVWMLGFMPLPVEVLKAVDPQLETVNKNLEAYYDAWDKFINAWIVIKIKDPSCAEIAMREGGQPGMSDEEVKDFVSRYLPAYNAYLPTLYSEGPNGSDPEHLLLFETDEGTNPV